MYKFNGVLGMLNIVLILENLATILSIILLTVQIIVLVVNICKDYRKNNNLKVGDYQQEIENIKEDLKEINEKNEI